MGQRGRGYLFVSENSLIHRIPVYQRLRMRHKKKRAYHQEGLWWKITFLYLHTDFVVHTCMCHNYAIHVNLSA